MNDETIELPKEKTRLQKFMELLREIVRDYPRYILDEVRNPEKGRAGFEPGELLSVPVSMNLKKSYNKSKRYNTARVGIR